MVTHRGPAVQAAERTAPYGSSTRWGHRAWTHRGRARPVSGPGAAEGCCRR